MVRCIPSRTLVAAEPLRRRAGPTVAIKIAGTAEPGVWRPDAALNLRTGHRVNALRRGESSIL